MFPGGWFAIGRWSSAIHGFIRGLINHIVHMQQIRLIVRLLNHFSFLELLYYLVLPVMECYEKHVHILERCRFLIKFGLQYRVIHEVYSCHASNDHICRLVWSVISMMSSGCIPHYRRTNDGINVLKSTVSPTILVKSISFVNCSLAIGSSHLLGKSSSNTAVQNIVSKIRR